MDQFLVQESKVRIQTLASHQMSLVQLLDITQVKLLKRRLESKSIRGLGQRLIGKMSV